MAAGAAGNVMQWLRQDRYARADFYFKLERLAVRKSFRRFALAFDLVRTGINFARRKGFTRIYGHPREGLV